MTTRQTAPPRFASAAYKIVRLVPRGQVVTYGQVAAMLGHPRAARAVGTALSRLPRHLAKSVPWQRVVNAAGRISHRGDLLRPDLQKRLLEREGVRFAAGGKIDLRRYRWYGSEREPGRPLRPTPIGARAQRDRAHGGNVQEGRPPVRLRVEL